MSIQFTFKELFELSQTDGELDGEGTSSHFSKEPNTIQMPTCLGNGGWKFLQLRDGVSLTITEAQFAQPTEITRQTAPYSGVKWSFYLSGSGSGVIDCFPSSLRWDQGNTGLLHIVDSENGSVSFSDDRPHCMISIDTSYDEWDDQGLGRGVPSHLRRRVDGTVRDPYVTKGLLTSEMHMAIHQILHCPFNEDLRSFYLEIKAHELIALQLKSMAEQNQPCRKTAILRGRDIERIREAAGILEQTLASPPSLLGLARQVGINDTKLKRGFRHVFGTSVFGYLHDQRLECARQLLYDHELTIQQIAHRVGYACSSYFSLAFRRKFGMNPSQFRRT